MVRQRVWIVIVAALAAVAVVAAVLLWCLPRRGGAVATVYVDGVAVYSVDLAQIDAPYEKVITTPYGNNTLAFEKGRVRVASADCEGADCVHQGWTSSSGRPLVCLPHRLVVRIADRDDNAVVQ